LPIDFFSVFLHSINYCKITGVYKLMSLMR
jgi:hypothetical protein